MPFWSQPSTSIWVDVDLDHCGLDSCFLLAFYDYWIERQEMCGREREGERERGRGRKDMQKRPEPGIAPRLLRYALAPYGTRSTR